MREIKDDWNITDRKIVTKSPQRNGLAEKMNQTISFLRYENRELDHRLWDPGGKKKCAAEM